MLPFFHLGVIEIGLIVGAVILISALVKRERRPTVHFSAAGHRPPSFRGHAHRPYPPPMRPPPRPPRPAVSVAHLILSLLFFPFVLFAWGLASIGDAVSLPVHLVVAAITFFPALFASVIGAGSRRLWEATGQQIKLAGKAFLNILIRLLTFFGFGGLVDTLRPLPRPMPAPPAPAPAPPRPRAYYPFEDRYRIESMLGTGGSTARLFVVRRVERHRPVGDRLVLKYFDMGMGSRLEEVIRESRGMQVAKDMGIVLDHSLARDHFYYVMPYYEGETLTRAAARVHRQLRAGEGMGEADLRTMLGWMSEILRILDGYHRHGVIHKDVKPDNVIVTEQGVRIVDLGLLTPLASALTLTTHGTEYFRDPEMVKLAVQGRRVKDVHAVRFDVYSAGAVMYLLLDGSFPACGPLSKISRPVPMVLSWITSRAMAEGEKRYPSIAAMRADLEAAIRLGDAQGFANVPVSQLPSFSGFSPDLAPPPPPTPAQPTVPPEPLPPRLEPVAAPRPNWKAPSRHRSGGLGIVIALIIVGLVTLALFFGFFFVFRTTRHPVRSPSLAPALPADVAEDLANTVPIGSTLTPDSLSSFVKNWRTSAQRNLDRVGGGEIDDVPVLLVGDDTLVVQQLVRETKVRLASEGIRFHPSARLAKIVAALPPEAGPADIQAALLPEIGLDTLPMVLRITDLGYHAGARSIVVRGIYSGSLLTRTFRGVGPRGEEGR